MRTGRTTSYSRTDGGAFTMPFDILVTAIMILSIALYIINIWR